MRIRIENALKPYYSGRRRRVEVWAPFFWGFFCNSFIFCVTLNMQASIAFVLRPGHLSLVESKQYGVVVALNG